MFPIGHCGNIRTKNEYGVDMSWKVIQEWKTTFKEKNNSDCNCNCDRLSMKINYFFQNLKQHYTTLSTSGIYKKI